MDFKHGIVQSVYRAARRMLCDVDTMADVVLFAASASQDGSACSQTARLGFEALEDTVDAVFFMSGAAAGSVPGRTELPSVTYISLTGDASNLFADDDGHRFLVLQCHGHARVIQACKGAYGYTAGRGTLYTCRRSAEQGIGCGRCCVDPLYSTTRPQVHIGN